MSNPPSASPLIAPKIRHPMVVVLHPTSRRAWKGRLFSTPSCVSMTTTQEPAGACGRQEACRSQSGRRKPHHCEGSIDERPCDWRRYIYSWCNNHSIR
mmetsp:Transcript_37372/g.55944  ORF Transcript_37372/g.55944 Transcript_37372/m.55944 type:complete len:98 (+) Transcript_37372:510-803(+)